MCGGGNPDHGRGVAGEYAGVAAEIAVARGAGGAQADPERQAGEEQHALLGEQGDQGDHHAEADQGSDDAVEALGQDLPLCVCMTMKTVTSTVLGCGSSRR